MTNDLNARLAKWLIEQDPGLLQPNNPEAFARAAAALSVNLGCTLASVLVAQGRPAFEEAVQAAVRVIIRNGVETADKASDMRRRACN